MTKQICKNCQKELGRLGWKLKKNDVQQEAIPFADQMNEDDVICNDCFQSFKEESKEEKKELSEQQKQEQEELKKKGKQEEEQITQDLLEKRNKLKPFWHKDNVIQYKDEYIAILRRTVGAQVEFIAAFRDLTKEGYRLMVQDEGLQASGSSISGGVSSYYYFQKMEHVR